MDFRVPAHWPVIEPGLFMDHIGPVLIVYCDERIGDEAFERQIAELARAIDDRQQRVGVLYDVPSLRGMHAKRRKQLAAMLEERKARLEQTTAAYALATDSPVVRGLLRAVFWVAPPPYPHRVVASSREAFAFIAGALPPLRAEDLEADYRARLRKHGVLAPRIKTA